MVPDKSNQSEEPHTLLHRDVEAGPGEGTTIDLPDGYGDSGAFTVEAWIDTPGGRTDAHQVLVADWSLRGDLTAFESHDAGATDGLNPKGFFGSVCDGRYVYFAPQLNDNGRHGQVLRYDSHGGFQDQASWSAYDAGATSGLNTKGYYGAVHAGDYVYFVPRTDDDAHHSRLLRYDRRGDFRDAGSWSAYDIGNPVSYQSAAYDGRYIYLSPGYESDGSDTGRAVRCDTQGAFDDPASYVTYDAGNTSGLDTTNYDGAVFDGRYIYYIPLNGRGIVLRHDTAGAFDSPDSWTGLDVSGLGMQMCVGAVFDGRYIYYVQYAHTVAIRYDTQAEFGDLASWEAYDAGGTSGLKSKGYDGAAFDGRYVYYIPFYDGDSPKSGFHCQVLRYDTLKGFGEPAAWTASDGGEYTDPPNPGGFNGGAFDGRFVYFTPWREDPEEGDDRRFTPHGKVMRYDTATDESVFALKYEECGHNGGLTASLPGPTFTVSTDRGTYSARSNRSLEPGRHHFAGVYDGQCATLYVDGEAVAEVEAKGRVATGPRRVGIGRLSEGGAEFRGRVGTVRISDTARSADWIEAASDGRDGQ
jgi:hypothetical protein